MTLDRIRPWLARLLPHPVGALTLMLCIGVFQVSTMRAGHVWGGDFSLYIMHAANLAEGRAYADTAYIADPYIGPPAYPPLFPLLLAPIYRIWGFDLTAMKLLVCGSFLVALWFVYLVLRRESDTACALIVVGLTGANPWLWDFKDQILSDVPFAAFVFIALAVAQRVLDKDKSPLQALIAGFALGLSVYLAYATRSLGIVLIPVIGGAWLLGTRRPIMPVVGAAAAFGLAFLAHRLNFGGAYSTYFSLDADVVLVQSYTMFAILAAYLDPGYADVTKIAAFLVLGALCALGYAIRVRQRIRLPETFVILYPAPLLLFDGYFPQRYLIPLIPFLFFYAVVGVAWLGRRYLGGRAVAAVAATILAVSVIYGARYSTLDFGPLEAGIRRPESVALFEHVRRTTAGDDAIIFFKPRVMALMTGRPSASYYGYRDANEIWGLVRRIDARHVVVEQLSEGESYGSGPSIVRELVQSCSECFELSFANADFEVFRLVEVPAGAGIGATEPPPYRPAWRDSQPGAS